MSHAINALAVVTLVSRARRDEPFDHAHENDAYAHLAMLSRQAGIELHVAHFDNARGGGRVLCWALEGGEWRPKELAASEVSVAYADLPPNEPEANVLRRMLVDAGATFVNDLRMNDALTDKLLTYQLWPELVPLTLEAGTPSLRERLATEVARHPDLRADEAILKPRYGERGKQVETVEVSSLGSGAEPEGFIVQPLMDSEDGIPELGITGRHDLRMMVQDGEVTDFFVRVAPEDGFICNQSHGGTIAYFALHELPPRFGAVAGQVDEALAVYSPRYYSIDVGVGRSGKIWVYELNTMPGIIWNAQATDKERYVGMHASIVDVIARAARRRHR